MRVTATTDSPKATDADTVAVAVFEDEDVAHDVSDGALQALLDSGEAKRRFRALAVTHADGKRWILVGLGARDRFDGERARAAAAAVLGRARELSATTLCWEVPHHVGDDVVTGLVDGTLLAAYRFDRFKSSPSEEGGDVEDLVLSAHHDIAAVVHRAAVVATAVNAARDLQNAPPNHMTPSALARRAQQLDGMPTKLSATVAGREEIEQAGMGAFAAVARGSDEEPALITLTYRGASREEGFDLGLVGKAVTFDTGGISLKPAGKMHEMKFDMSGGAAVIEAMGAIAALELPVDVVAIVGATENMPSGHAVKPSDIVTAMTGTTIEVNNTDAEGRLVLADCLARCVELGAERIVDLATLTGAMVVALGSTYTGMMSNDDAWAVEIADASTAMGEPVWRLPLHEQYADLIKGRYADIVNSTEARKAGSITAAEFLKRFVGDTPWAHLDIAGTANDTGWPWAPKGGTGVGVRLLVELARRLGGERPV
jgi:leucyl aminopeptidase